MKVLQLLAILLSASLVSPLYASTGDFCEYYGPAERPGTANFPNADIQTPNGTECTELFPVWADGQTPFEISPMSGAYSDSAPALIQLHACGLKELLAEDQAFITMADIHFRSSRWPDSDMVLSLTATASDGKVLLIMETRQLVDFESASARRNPIYTPAGPAKVIGKLTDFCDSLMHHSLTRIEIRPDAGSVARVRIVSRDTPDPVWIEAIQRKSGNANVTYTPYFISAGVLLASDSVHSGSLQLTWPGFPH